MLKTVTDVEAETLPEQPRRSCVERKDHHSSQKMVAISIVRRLAEENLPLRRAGHTPSLQAQRLLRGKLVVRSCRAARSTDALENAPATKSVPPAWKKREIDQPSVACIRAGCAFEPHRAQMQMARHHTFDGPVVPEVQTD